MRNFFIGFLIVAALVAGGGLVANVAYQAGLSTAITTVAQTAPEGSIVTPVVPGAYPGYGYGYGYGHGWGGPGSGVFGFLGTLFVIFLIFGLLRLAFFRGRGWGGPGRGGPGGWGGPSGRGHMHDTFESWHRESHEGPGSPSSTNPTNPTGQTGPTSPAERGA